MQLEAERSCVEQALAPLDSANAATGLIDVLALDMVSESERRERLVDRDLGDIRRFCELATPGTWYCVNADDTYAMSLIGVATDRSVDDTSARMGTLDHTKMIAATHVQGTPVRGVC